MEANTMAKMKTQKIVVATMVSLDEVCLAMIPDR
jgi:hypothetical protein